MEEESKIFEVNKHTSPFGIIAEAWKRTSAPVGLPQEEMDKIPDDAYLLRNMMAGYAIVTEDGEYVGFVDISELEVHCWA